ncbi:MAG: hypothetical protein ABUK11_07390, partial [Mariprofundaceae bacterium]
AEYAETVHETRELGLKVCTHLILGLPGEDRAMMMESLQQVLDIGADGLKFHPLHVVRHTRLASDWKRGDVALLQQQDYVSLVCDMLEVTPSDYVIHRLTGTASDDVLLAPAWCGGKWQVINAIYRELGVRKSFQGSRFRPTPESKHQPLQQSRQAGESQQVTAAAS